MPTPTSISSYADCEELSREKPIRGRAPKQWWLDNDRRAGHLFMLNPRDGVFSCRMYATDLVTYHDDGAVELRTYSSHTTVPVARAWAPYGARPLLHRGYMYWCVDALGGARYLRGHTVLHPAGNLWEVAQQEHDNNGVRFVANKEKGRAVAKLPFVKAARDIVGGLAALDHGGEPAAPSGAGGYYQRTVTPLREVDTRLVRALMQAAQQHAMGEPYEAQLAQGILAAYDAMPKTWRNAYVLDDTSVRIAAQALFDCETQVRVPLSALPLASTTPHMDRSAVAAARDQLRGLPLYADLLRSDGR